MYYRAKFKEECSPTCPIKMFPAALTDSAGDVPMVNCSNPGNLLNDYLDDSQVIDDVSKGGEEDNHGENLTK